MGLRLRTWVAALLVALLATGCPVGPNFKRPEVESPANYRGAVAPSEAASLADLPWWQVFADPVLRSLVGEALQNNYDLKTAVQRVEQSRAQVGVARSPLFPQLGYQGGAQRGKNFVFTSTDTFNIFLGTFNLAWEIDVWGRIRRATEAAQGELYQSEEIRRGIMLSLVSDVAQAYFQLLELDLELEIAHGTVKSFTDTVDLFTRRFQGGVGNKLAVERAIAALAQAEASVPTLENQIVTTEDRLNVLLGRNPGPIERGAPLVAQEAPPSTPPGIPSQVLERRPDVRQAEDVLITTNANIGVAVANFFPVIGLTSLYGGESTELKNVVKSQGNIWNVAGSIVGPIFTGGQNVESYYAQVAVFEQSKAQYAQTVLKAFAEVSDTLTSQEKLVEIRAANEKAVTALQESVRLALLRYNQGLANYYEVLEAQQQLYPAQNQLAQTERDQLIVVVELYRALGGGWQVGNEEWMGGPAAAPPGAADAGAATIPVDPNASTVPFQTPRSATGSPPPLKATP